MSAGKNLKNLRTRLIKFFDGVVENCFLFLISLFNKYGAWLFICAQQIIRASKSNRSSLNISGPWSSGHLNWNINYPSQRLILERHIDTCFTNYMTYICSLKIPPGYDFVSFPGQITWWPVGAATSMSTETFLWLWSKIGTNFRVLKYFLIYFCCETAMNFPGPPDKPHFTFRL